MNVGFTDFRVGVIFLEKLVYIPEVYVHTCMYQSQLEIDALCETKASRFIASQINGGNDDNLSSISKRKGLF